MAIAYRLTPDLRKKLKNPIGTLIKGSSNGTMNRLKNLIQKENPPMIIFVGDTVSQNSMKAGIPSNLYIIDKRVMRRNIQPVGLSADRIIHVENPPGTITEEAFTAVQEALKHDLSVKIVVDGEEDLLALVAVFHAPENSLVVYGQPREGIVVIKSTQQKKTEVIQALKAMKILRKTK